MAGNGGKRVGAGRKPGVPNKLNRTAREAFEIAFDTLGGPQGLSRWAQKHQSDFYKLYAKLIPMQVEGSGEITLRVRYVDKKNPEDAE